MLVSPGFLASIDKNGGEAFPAASACQGFGAWKRRADKALPGVTGAHVQPSGHGADAADVDGTSSRESVPFSFGLI